MQSVRFQEFRGFQDSQWIELRPITLLIGENSTGKTSFLAGIRYLLQSFERSSVVPFNQEPYYLGSFSEIAHYRGGRGGRAKEFKLSIDMPIRNFASGEKTSGTQLKHEFVFGRGSPQPQIASYRFEADRVAIKFDFDKEMPNAMISGTSGSNIPVPWSSRRSPPSEIVKNNSSYIRFLLDDFTFSLNPAESESVQAEQDLETIGLSNNAIHNIFRSARRAAYGLSQNVFASAPVRTQPLRTYTPSEIILSSEGSHVPLELARIKARSQTQWKQLKDKLVSFGSKAHLFSDVEIKQFGKKEVDPFQLMFKIDGPAMNVVDVGYGISQILPIVYQIQNPGRYSTFLLQQPEVHLHPRAQAELGSLISHAVSEAKHPLFVLETHSDYLVDRLRIEIAEGKLPAENVTIVFFRRKHSAIEPTNIFFNDDGDLRDPPDGFRDFFLEEHSRLLGM